MFENEGPVEQFIPVSKTQKFVGAGVFIYPLDLIFYDPEDATLSCAFTFKTEDDCQNFDHKFMQLQRSLVDLFTDLSLEDTESLKNFLIEFMKRDMNGLI